MSPVILAKPRPRAAARAVPAAPAVPVHWAAAPCTAPGRVTGKPGEVSCPDCIEFQAEQAWTIHHTRPAVTR